MERLKCWICPSKFFENCQLYDHHTEEVHKGYRYRCDECAEGILFKDVDEARAHIDDKHDFNMLQCPSCSLKINEFNLRKHMREIHQQSYGFKCDLCSDKLFEDRENYEKHIQDVHQGYRVKCPVCHKMLKTKLQVHMDSIHLEGKVRCKICNRGYSTKYKLIRHLKTHMDPKEPGLVVRCARCDETFENTFKLNQHKKHQTKVYQCEKCSKLFYRNQSLQRHQRNHET
ncbi:oocyte zinc finger protein XlCOF28-like isoform X2 [Uranotaenia lowii]|uniref:oocyte zinc finger protein XlCOF28-like isoform X2 n=1 Tax=Uranotaenia lowii TaxID=190385 RepID=UPI00247AB2CF|nr:oocyte zinc finger protein XlCOF28-like isoform X2 [Uranotaenia lowii]